MAEMVTAYGFIEKTIISSFNHYCLMDLKNENPDIVTAPLYTGLFSFMGEYTAKLGASAIHPLYRDITPDVIKNCREHNIVINTWTIDTESDMERLTRQGIDDIITNVPDVALMTLE